MLNGLEGWNEMFLLPTLQLIFQVYTPHEGKCRFLRGIVSNILGHLDNVDFGVVSSLCSFKRNKTCVPYNISASISCLTEVKGSDFNCFFNYI